MTLTRLFRSLSHPARNAIRAKYKENACLSRALGRVRNYKTGGSKKVFFEEMHETPKEEGLVSAMYRWRYHIASIVVYSSFEEFKDKLLGIPGLVDCIVVDRADQTVQVSVKPSVVDCIDVSDKRMAYASVESWMLDRTTFTKEGFPKADYEGADKIMFKFKIESVESFEEKLKEAQQALRIDPSDYVRVRYKTSLSLW